MKGEIFFLLFLAGIFNALMDRTSSPDNFVGTWLFNLRTSWFNDRMTTAGNKWKNGDPDLGERFLFSSTLLVAFTDFWHFAKSCFLYCLAASLAIASPVLADGRFLTPILAILLNVLLYRLPIGVSFNLYYSEILKDPSKMKKQSFPSSLFSWLGRKPVGLKIVGVFAGFFFFYFLLATGINLVAGFDGDGAGPGDKILGVLTAALALVILIAELREKHRSDNLLKFARDTEIKLKLSSWERFKLWLYEAPVIPKFIGFGGAVFLLWVFLSDLVDKLDPRYNPEDPLAFYLGDWLAVALFVAWIVFLLVVELQVFKKEGR